MVGPRGVPRPGMTASLRARRSTLMVGAWGSGGRGREEKRSTTCVCVCVC